MLHALPQRGKNRLEVFNTVVNAKNANNRTMRKWEVEDAKVIPSDLVREQDFILKIRRLHRLAEPTLVINIPLTSIEPGHGGRGPLEEVQERLKSFAQKSGGDLVEMANGDVFLVWPEANAVEALPDWVMNVVLPDGVTPEDMARFRLVYRLPADYSALRERAYHYVELSREAAAAAAAAECPASQLLQSETARGPLTAWGADQIEKLLRDIDLHRYLRTQPVYQRGDDALWRPVLLEIYMGVNDLKLAHFPKIDISGSDHLFLELCQTIDQRLLVELSGHPEIFDGPNVSLNVSVPSVMGTTFARFARAVPATSRGAVFCELNCADLWQDFAMTINAMELLRREGFRVVIDNVTPDMLPYLNLSLFNADYIKVNASKENAGALEDSRVRATLSTLPREKIIFFRCDNEQALNAGLDLGVARFQGWLIDDLARKQ